MTLYDIKLGEYCGHLILLTLTRVGYVVCITCMVECLNFLTLHPHTHIRTHIYTHTHTHTHHTTPHHTPQLIHEISEENGHVIISFPRSGTNSDKVMLKGAQQCIEGARSQIQEVIKDLVSNMAWYTLYYGILYCILYYTILWYTMVYYDILSWVL